MKWFLVLLMSIAVVSQHHHDEFCRDERRTCHRCFDECHYLPHLRKMQNITNCPNTMKDTINCLLNFVPSVDVDID